MKKSVLIVAIAFQIIFGNQINAQSIKVLFDATKAEMAGNADWVPDADVFNIGAKSGGLMATGSGNEANPQRYPTPAQTGITSTTTETFWKGGLSGWAVELAKLGYQIETLPYNGQITYGNTSNLQDLSNYKVFVVCEPNIVFTTSQKQAIIQFVQNGGGLFMISDHDVSDRNNDGWDSPHIWNDLMQNNGLVTNPFGITFDYQNFSQTTTNFNTLPLDPILHGPKGNPTQMKFSNGTSMTLNTTANNSVLGIVYKTGSTKGTTNVMMAHAHYGNGKVVGLGDSSCPDDGTGDTNDQLFNGWTADANGDHKRIILNATIWLTTTTVGPYKESFSNDINSSLTVFPNPASDKINILLNENLSVNSQIKIYDETGRCVKNSLLNSSGEVTELNIQDLQKGFYIISVETPSFIYKKEFSKN